MKKNTVVVLLLLFMLCASIVLTGCDGLLKMFAKDKAPSISDTETITIPETTTPETTDTSTPETTTPETEPEATTVPAPTEPTTTEAPKPPQYTIDLIDEYSTLSLLGAGNFRRDGSKIFADNKGVGDTALMRPVKIEPGEHVLIEVSAIVHEGTLFGIMIGEKDYTDSFNTGWFCLNADLNFRCGRLFGAGGGQAEQELTVFAATFGDQHLSTGKEIRLALEILPDKTIRAYYNGTEFTNNHVVFNGFEGGYPGIMTFYGKVEFMSATLTYIGKEGP